jgi:hypothetical protein
MPTCFIQVGVSQQAPASSPSYHLRLLHHTAPTARRPVGARAALAAARAARALAAARAARSRGCGSARSQATWLTHLPPSHL